MFILSRSENQEIRPIRLDKSLHFCFLYDGSRCQPQKRRRRRVSSMKKKEKGKPDNGSKWLQNATLVVLTLTMVVIGYQAHQMRRSTDLLKYSVVIQNQPYLWPSSMAYLYNPETKSISLLATYHCFGNTPAHEAHPAKELLFFVPFPDALREKFKSASLTDAEVNERHFYHIGLLDIILGYIEKNPYADKPQLEKFLESITESSTRLTKSSAKVDVLLKIKTPQIYGEIDEYRKPPINIPPGGEYASVSRRSSSNDPLKDIEEFSGILIYYCVMRYQGVREGEYLTSHFLGYIDGRNPLKRVDLNRETKVPVVKYPMYEFITQRTWSPREKVPE